uniref:KRAB domain-containing protein n=1 Tax=Pyxicephalus adspersus TaxID=30357 RepID=A0AAV2ZSH8_PYXAD|nr:TPA: hypothetical protein GDO54_004755 [Pyxicephalus adspersus]
MPDPQKMDKERKVVSKKILSLTLEIIYLLTGEDYTVVKKAFGEHTTTTSHPQVSKVCRGSDDPGMEDSPISVIDSEDNNNKILEVTNKIIELLTEEVPIRCQDVAVYFSMEEWKYL